MALKLLFDRGGMYIYPWYISDITATSDLGEITGGLVVGQVVCVIEKDFLKMHYDLESTNQIGEYFLAQIKDDPSFYKRVIENIYKHSETVETFGQSLPQDLAKLSNAELLKLYSDYTQKLSTLRVWGWVPVFLDGMEVNHLTDHISQELKQHLDGLGLSDKFGQYYSVLSSSGKMSEVQQEELARLDVALTIQGRDDAPAVIVAIEAGDVAAIKSNYPQVYDLLAQHARQFGWLTYAYSGPAMTVEYLCGLISDNFKTGDVEAQKQKLVDHYDKIVDEKLKVAQEISLTEDLKYLLDVSAEFMFIKDYRKGVYQKSYVAMDPVMAEIARRLGISLKESKYLVLSEVEQALGDTSQAEEYAGKARQRAERCVYAVKDGQIEVFEGDEVDVALRQHLANVHDEDVASDADELTGMMAYNGVVRGVARVVLSADDVDKAQDGDVLVSSATNPDLIVAMKRAAAFVTDTGGITSHAAIVSRELKKPCVVGTKRATHVIKDGDEVEVDADKGVVKIIKRAE